MISPEEIVGMTELTEDEVAAIAEHERTTDVLAAGLVEYPNRPSAAIAPANSIRG